MITLTKYQRLFVLLLLLSGVLALAACGDPQPIAVFVTPTLASTASPVPSPIPVAQQPTQYAITPLPTPLPAPPGVTWGPITGPNYTPEPLFTPLPTELHERACTLLIEVGPQSLYASPDLSAAVVGSAPYYQRLGVTQFATDASGTRWAGTPAGWLPLVVDGVETAQVGPMRSCDIMAGTMTDTALAGLHVLNGTSVDQVMTYVRRMKQAGHPVATIKGLNGTEDMLNQIEIESPETITVYRSLINDWRYGDCPIEINESPDPAETAQHWLDALQPYWSKVNADYYEVVNECAATLEWLNAFSIEAMKIANQRGECLLLFSFAGGHPDMGMFDALLPAYQYAAENPCQPGRTHGIAMHAYSLQDNVLASESDKWLVFRHRILHDRLLQVLPEAANLPVIITEMGIGGGTLPPTCDDVVRDAVQYTYELEEDPYVQGFELWNVGTGAQWYDVTGCLPQLADALIEYYTPPG